MRRGFPSFSRSRRASARSGSQVRASEIRERKETITRSASSGFSRRGRDVRASESASSVMATGLSPKSWTRFRNTACLRSCSPSATFHSSVPGAASSGSSNQSACCARMNSAGLA